VAPVIAWAGCSHCWWADGPQGPLQLCLSRQVGPEDFARSTLGAVCFHAILHAAMLPFQKRPSKCACFFLKKSTDT
jgi:hypothetical protein